MKYVFETETTAKDGARVAISVPTTRPRILGQALAALANQTFQDFEVWIVYDDMMVVAEETAEIIKLLSVSHTVRELRGTGEGQVYAHNTVLWKTKSELCLRLDDDVLLDKTALGKMVGFLDENPDAGAVGGIWFPEGSKRGRLKSKDEIDANATIDNPNNGVQGNYHPSDDAVEMEHLYSVCLYRAAAMRQVGGWPVCYTRKLHHREETDGTHRLLLAGHRLVVLPSVTGIHLWAPGGIRRDPDVAEGYGVKRQDDDQMFFTDRLPRFPELIKSKKVVVDSEHTFHIAGGERHYYATLAALSEADDLEVWGSEDGAGVHDQENVGRYFGFDTSRVRGFRRRQNWSDAYGIDLAITVSHAMIPWFPARKRMGLVLFPMLQEKLDHFDRLYGNSRYTAYHIKKLWGREAGIIYPPPDKLEYDSGAKGNRILLVGWYGPQKGQHEAIQGFIQAKMSGWKLTTVGWIGEHQPYFDALKNMWKGFPEVEIVGPVDQAELRRLIHSSRIILGMRGINSDDPKWQEHFGLSVPEAMSAGAVPLLYKSAGYLDVYPRHLFSDQREMTLMLRGMANWSETLWDAEARMAITRSADFGYDRFRDEILAATYEVLRGGADSENPYVIGETVQASDISVVIPNYGHDGHLWESVGSVLASTYRDFEIVVVDDGSPDGSESAGMYKSDKIRILRQKNAGPAMARNAGIFSSKSSMVFPLDADDFIMPDALRQLRKANDGERITFGDCLLLREGEDLSQTSLEEYDFAKLLEMATIPQSALFPRWAWEQAGGYKPLRGYEDWEFWISLGEVGCGGKKIDTVTHVYRESATSGRHLEAKELNVELTAEIRDLHSAAYGNPQIGCCGPSERPVQPEWLVGTVLSGGAAEMPDAESGGDVMVVYDGPDAAPFSIRGDVSRQVYTVRRGQEFLANAEDIEFFMKVPGFRRV